MAISSKLKKIIDDDKGYLFQNYGDRLPVCFTKGEGAYLFDQNNRKYIDFFSGIAVCNLGYNNKHFRKAIHDQIDKLIHSSNWFYNKEQIGAAKIISELTFPGHTLFLNSGTEANEAAIKLARKYGLAMSKNRFEIISFSNSFHGRTLGSMTATAQEKIHSGFGPLPAGFKYLPYNDIKRFKNEVKKNKNIAAVMIELIQGEGGIIVAEASFVKEVFDICNTKNIITIVDEVQTGVGRTGKPFAFHHYGILPDIITLAKGLGGGIPVGAIHAKKYLSETLDRGSHGSTFGGNHLAAAAALTVLKEIKKKSFQKNVLRASDYIFNELKILKQSLPIIKEIRGMGLHIGIELNRPGMNMVRKALSRGLIINCTAEKVIRIMPPLNIPSKDVRSGMEILKEIFIEEARIS